MSEKFDWGEHTITDDENISLAGYDLHQSLEASQTYCSKIAKAHYENFVISNWFTPDEIRQHIENVYAFCRYGDDLGDDAPFPATQRLMLLDEWEQDLLRASEAGWSGSPRHPILRALQHTANEKAIPVEPFVKLIHAFKMDQTKNRYQNWEELKEYCSLSADPVGHLFLYVYGHDDEELRKLADDTCTALQLANHWQDVSRDLDQDRIYIPIEDMARFGYNLEKFQRRIVNDEWRALMRFEVERAQKLFDAGRRLWHRIDARLAVDLQMFTKGGEAVLKAIGKLDYNTLDKRPRISKMKQMRMFVACWFAWRRAQRRQRRINRGQKA